MQFEKNQKGYPTLLNNGYRYNKNTRENVDNTTIWRCVKRKICSATVTINKDNKIIRSSIHCCQPDDKANQVFRRRATCKKMVCEDLSSTVHTIVENTFEPLKEAFAETGEYVDYIPSTKEIQDSLYRARKSFLDSKCLTFSKLENIRIPEVLGKEFLVSEDGDEDKILIFCSKVSRRYIKHSKLEYFGDGTFKCVPSPFYQLYTLHVDLGSTHKSNNVVPVIYGLLPNKTENTYIRFFKLLSETLGIKMKSFKSDFEVAVINAVCKIFSGCRISGCHYHYSRAIWKKAKKIKLNKLSSGRKVLRLISQLPQLPASCINETWQSILAISPDCEEMHLFKQYFERQWLSKFSPNVLSCATLLHRTTNCLEGWHHRINVKMSLHPSLYRFIYKLRKEAKIFDYEISKSLFCEPKQNRKKSDIAFDIKLSVLLRELHNKKITNVQFLKRIIFSRLRGN